ncbi:MAG TPA: endolytic transglycosylase MltG [Acidobacteriaceae bacterium]|nr:endolytic transglycosylase MltG [Acidobacteriaceae bacterium]
MLAVVLAGAGFYFLLRYPAGPGTTKIVTIAPGSSVGQIATELKADGVIRSRHAFALWARIEAGTLKAGTYRFDHPAPMTEVYERLQSGDVYTIALTIPEGYNIFDIAQAIERAGLGKNEDFLAAEQKNTDLIQDLDPNAQSLEGYLFPDTYQVAPNTPPREILATMVRRFREAATALGLNMNVHAVVTLASLVERETPVEADRPLVAGVFANRMARGMSLDTDPSVIYAALLEKRYRGTIYASDLKADSSYNTYMHAGLPPGPICSPGLPSLRAAMQPAKTDYLYFVSDPEHPGHSRFATTLEEHEKNVTAYRNEQHRGSGR